MSNVISLLNGHDGGVRNAKKSQEKGSKKEEEVISFNFFFFEAPGLNYCLYSLRYRLKNHRVKMFSSFFI